MSYLIENIVTDIYIYMYIYISHPNLTDNCRHIVIQMYSCTLHYNMKQYSQLLRKDCIQLCSILNGENTPHRPMITHTIDSYQIPSKKNMERM